MFKLSLDFSYLTVCGYRAGDLPPVLQLPHNEPPEPVLQCSDDMCPIRVHWHVMQSYREYWRVKITVTNLNYVKNYSQWNLVVLHPNLQSVTRVFSFNYKPLNQYGDISKFISFVLIYSLNVNYALISITLCIFRWYWSVLWDSTLQWHAAAGRSKWKCADRNDTAQRSRDFQFQRRVGISQKDIIQWWTMCIALTARLPQASKCCRVLCTGSLLYNSFIIAAPSYCNVIFPSNIYNRWSSLK